MLYFMRYIKYFFKSIFIKIFGDNIYQKIKYLKIDSKFNSADSTNEKILIISSKEFYTYLTRYIKIKYTFFVKFNLICLIYIIFFKIQKIIIDDSSFFLSNKNQYKSFLCKLLLSFYKIDLLIVRDEKEYKDISINNQTSIVYIEFYNVIDFVKKNDDKEKNNKFKFFFNIKKNKKNILVSNEIDHNKLNKKIKSHPEITKNYNFINIQTIINKSSNKYNFEKYDYDLILIDPEKKNYSKKFQLLLIQSYFRCKNIILINKKNILDENINQIISKFNLKTFLFESLKHNNQSMRPNDIELYKKIFEEISNYKSQLNEYLLSNNKVSLALNNKDIAVFFTLNRLNNLKKIEENINRFERKVNKIFFLCHKFKDIEKDKIKEYFSNLKIEKKFLFEDNLGHGSLINKVLKQLKKDTIWIKLDDDDDYYTGYIDEVLANIRISNCYYVGKKIGFYHFNENNDYYISENIFNRTRMNKKHISGATMAGVSNLIYLVKYPEIETNKLDVLISKECKLKKIDFFIGSGLYVKVNRGQNDKHTWKIYNFKDQIGKNISVRNNIYL